MLVVFAFGAVSASAASAAEFHAESAPVKVDGTQVGVDEFTVNAGTTKCNEATYSGENAAKTTAAFSVTPKYSECSVEPIGTAIVHTNGCFYEATILQVTSATDAHGELHIKCPAGQSITVTASALGTLKCTIHVPPQTIPVTLTTHGLGTARDLTVDVNVANLQYSQTAGSGLGACKTEAGLANGKYKGTATLKGTTSLGAAQGIWIE